MAHAEKTTTFVANQDSPYASLDSEAACLVVLNGKDIGNVFTLDETVLLAGRSEVAKIRMKDASVSRLHAKIVVMPTTTRILDLDSTNGTFVNDIRVSDRKVVDGDILRFGSISLKYLSGKNVEQSYHKNIYRLSTTDALTQTLNRSYLIEFLERELESSRRYGRLFSVAMFDIDNFKLINDKYGHSVGDYVLREVAAVAGRNLRKADVFARYGGDEFSVIFPELDHDKAYTACEKLRTLIADEQFCFNNRALSVTISIGLRTVHPEEKDLDVPRIVAEADARLLEAKRQGRNRTAHGLGSLTQP